MVVGNTYGIALQCIGATRIITLECMEYTEIFVIYLGFFRCDSYLPGMLF